ncbi:hypothetical protein [Methylophaga sp. OBS1]|uniref:hypothetical protein n=1 Tax=Methylophaga sp. OBS1 TaxID=2991933 RepID=UPI002257F4EE|nr:hypothetical protein [Methylophaga sp. OBS1]MCX4192528.1 hypothetical protein [Methylophaga sp. OBS1]
MRIMISTDGKESSPPTSQEGLPATRRFKPKAVALSAALIFCITAPHHAYAELPEMGVFANAHELSDDVLGETRGKFVSGGQIMTFGVQMMTEWITSSGEVINASGRLAISMGQGQPRVSFEPVINVHQVQVNQVAVSQGTNVVSGSKGLDSVTGVVQSIQVAGNANGIGNSIGVSVRRYNGGHGVNTSNSPGNLNVITPSGNAASVSLANNGLSVAVDVVDQGQAQQAIRSISQGNGQVMQSVRLGGSLNQIRNMINLDIQTRIDRTGPNLNQQQVLSSLRQLSPTLNF